MKQVIDGSRPILLVSRDADDGSWHFLTGEDLAMEDAKLVSLGSIVKLDPSVCDVADLPLGGSATRRSAEATWRRRGQAARSSAGVDVATVRRIALGLNDATEVQHMDRRAFRTPRRIFTTVAANEKSCNVKLSPLEQKTALLRMAAAVPLNGGWGRMGWTEVDLARVSLEEIEWLLATAHASAAPVAKKGTPAKLAERAPVVAKSKVKAAKTKKRSVRA